MLERLAALVKQGHRAVRQPHVRSTARPQRFADAHDCVGIGVRQRSQQDAVDDAEHRGVRAYAQGEQHYHRGREARTSSQAAESVSCVSPQVIDPACASAVAERLASRIRARCRREHDQSSSSWSYRRVEYWGRRRRRRRRDGLSVVARRQRPGRMVSLACDRQGSEGLQSPRRPPSRSMMPGRFAGGAVVGRRPATGWPGQ